MQSKVMTEWEKLALKIEQEDWRELAASIAITVITLLNRLNMSKQQLADKMGVKPQYVSRVVKGHANLTLDTIVKLEKALGETIITVSDPTDIVSAASYFIAPDTKWTRFFKVERNLARTAALDTKRQPKVVFAVNEDDYSQAS